MLNLLKKTPHRNQLEQYLREHLPRLSGSILEIGSKNRRYDHLLKEKPAAIDLMENKEKEVKRGDINALEFQDGSFSNIVCLEVLEYVNTPEKAVSEMYRVLSPGGTLVLSVPYMYALHDDQLRYSELFLKELFTGFKKVEIYAIGNAYTVILDILYGKIKKIHFSFFRHLVTLLYAPFTLFIPKKVARGGKYISGYFIVAHKSL